MDNLVVKRGRNFRLLDADELPKLLDFVSEYLPESLKVSFSYNYHFSIEKH